MHGRKAFRFLALRILLFCNRGCRRASLENKQLSYRKSQLIRETRLRSFGDGPKVLSASPSIPTVKTEAPQKLRAGRGQNSRCHWPRSSSAQTRQAGEANRPMRLLVPDPRKKRRKREGLLEMQFSRLEISASTTNTNTSQPRTSLRLRISSPQPNPYQSPLVQSRGQVACKSLRACKPGFSAQSRRGSRRHRTTTTTT